VLGVGQGNKAGDGFGADGRGGEVAVQDLGVVVFGNGQGPN